MAQSFEETAHKKIDPKKYAEGWGRIFGKKSDSAEPKTTHMKVVDGKVVEISEEEALKNNKHETAGMCGEYGISSFDKEAYDENFDKIKWKK